MAVAPILFYIPIFGWMARSCGLIPATNNMIKKALIEKYNVILYLGGIEELIAYEKNELYIKKRWGYLKAKNEWITFLFRYFSHLESFNHDQFMASSVGFIMKKTTLGFQKIKVQLLKITSDALYEGEMKFLPFMNLLNDLDINDQVSPLPNTYLVKYHPSRNFISVITYYIVNGSLPVDYAFLIKSYLWEPIRLLFLYKSYSKYFTSA